jgi:hypothetical protein
MKQPGQRVATTPNPYLSASLLPAEAAGYKAAGVLPLRRTPEGGLEFMLALERRRSRCLVTSSPRSGAAVAAQPLPSASPSPRRVEGESKQLVVESPWSQLTSGCQRI